MAQVVGTCSLCNGPVTISGIWMGTYPPTPECRNCGAVPEVPYGPTITMKPKTGSNDWRTILHKEGNHKE